MPQFMRSIGQMFDEKRDCDNRQRAMRSMRAILMRSSTRNDMARARDDTTR
jgi:hypothetical protein